MTKFEDVERVREIEWQNALSLHLNDEVAVLLTTYWLRCLREYYLKKFENKDIE